MPGRPTSLEKSIPGLYRACSRCGLGCLDSRFLSLGDGPTWLVGCLGFNGPFKQYFSLYRGVSQRRRKKEK